MSVFYPREGQQWLAGKVRTALAACEMRLYKAELTVSENTTLAQLEEAEADYSGYAAQDIANFGAVFQTPLGAGIQSPLVQFQPTPAPTITNDIGGAFVVDSTGALVTIISFPAAKPMASELDAIPISEILRFGSGL